MITKQISLYTWDTNNVIIYANSGEVDCRYIEVSFKDENQNNINLTNKSVTFYAKKPDNTTIFNYCTVNTVDNTATIELTSQTLSVPGILECEFQIFDENNVLLKVSGLKIFISASKDFSKAIESTSEANVLTSVINETKELSKNIGDLNNLNTVEKNTVVEAINEVNSKNVLCSSSIGELSNLNTSEKNTVIEAINEVNSKNIVCSSSIGELGNLNTSEKNTVVEAINEVNSKNVPISQGGTGANTISSARTNLEIPATVLYINTSGTNGTITLSQPYTDFSRIGVYAQGQYDNSSVYNEICTYINYMTLAASSAADSNHDCTVWRTAFINFSENTITFATNCSSSYHSIAGYNIGTYDGLKITRVVGYNY